MRFIQCALCPKLVDTYNQNCGFELYRKQIPVPGFKSPKIRTDKLWFHLDCYYNRRHNRWGTDGPPRINGEPFVVRSEPILLPVIPKLEPEISEIIEAGEITIANRPLEIKDVESESMSKYFEDVSMKEVAQASNKALDAIRKRFRKIGSNQQGEYKLEISNEIKKEKERLDKERKEEAEYTHDYENTKRNVKIIEGKREDGTLILREVQSE